jgi:hypothetical protein
MPDTIMPPSVPDEPLWSRRLNDQRKKSDRFFREARKRDGRPIAFEAIQTETERINTVKDGRIRPLSAGAIKTGVSEQSAQGQYGMTKTVGSGAAQRQGAARVNDRAFERMKAEGQIEKSRVKR